MQNIYQFSKNKSENKEIKSIQPELSQIQVLNDQYFQNQQYQFNQSQFKHSYLKQPQESYSSKQHGDNSKKYIQNSQQDFSNTGFETITIKIEEIQKGGFSYASVIIKDKQLLFKKLFLNKELEINSLLKNKGITLDLITDCIIQRSLIFIAGDKDLETVKNIIQAKNLYLNVIKYDEFVKLIFQQLIKRLKQMHDLQICHSDIKPMNIMLGFNGQFYFVDFGGSIVGENDCINYKKYFTDKYNFRCFGKEFEFKTIDQAKICDLSQLYLTILYLFIFNEEENKLFREKEFSECINKIIENRKSKKVSISNFLLKLQKLIHYFDRNNNQDNSFSDLPIIFDDFINLGSTIYEELQDFYFKDQIIFIRQITTDNINLIKFLCNTQKYVELSNDCFIQIQKKELDFLMKKLKIDSKQLKDCWQVKYCKKKLKQINTNNDKILLNLKEHKLEDIPQQVEESKLERICLSIKYQQNQIKINQEQSNESIQNQLFSKYSQDISDLFFQHIQYIIKTIIFWTLMKDNLESIYEEQKYMYLNFSQFQTLISYIGQELQIHGDLEEFKILQSSIENIDLQQYRNLECFLEQVQPIQLIQLYISQQNQSQLSNDFQMIFIKFKTNSILQSVLLDQLARKLNDNRIKIILFDEAKKLYELNHTKIYQKLNEEEEINWIPELLFQLDTTYKNKGELKISIYYSFQTYEYLKKNNNTSQYSLDLLRSQILMCKNFLIYGKTQWSVFDLEKILQSIKGYKQEVQNDKQYQYCLTGLLQSMYQSYHMLFDYKKSKQYSQSSINVCKQFKNGNKTEQDYYGVAIACNGFLLTQQQQTNLQGINQIVKSLKIFAKNQNFNWFVYSLYFLAFGYYKENLVSNKNKILTISKCCKLLYNFKILNQQTINLIQKIKNYKSKQIIIYFKKLNRVLKDLDIKSDLDLKNLVQDEAKLNIECLESEIYFLSTDRQKKKIAIEIYKRQIKDRDDLSYGKNHLHVFKLCARLSEMYEEVQNFSESLYYQRRQLDILRYLNDNDNPPSDNKNYYLDLLKQSYKRLAELYQKLNMDYQYQSFNSIYLNINQSPKQQ